MLKSVGWKDSRQNLRELYVLCRKYRVIWKEVTVGRGREVPH